jgi:hypothetical protein
MSFAWMILSILATFFRKWTRSCSVACRFNDKIRGMDFAFREALALRPEAESPRIFRQRQSRAKSGKAKDAEHIYQNRFGWPQGRGDRALCQPVADALVEVSAHPNKRAILSSLPNAAYMAGPVVLTFEEGSLVRGRSRRRGTPRATASKLTGVRKVWNKRSRDAGIE